jgi:L-lactate dehydrogenase
MQSEQPLPSTKWRARKVVVVGAGSVGSTFAYALAQDGSADEVVLLDQNQDLMQGQVLDLAHGLPFYPPVQVRAGSPEDYADAHVVVTNPVDILTYVAARRAGGAPGRVIGSGTVLDSARLRYLLSQHFNIDVRNTHAYVLGEHGDSEFAAWSMTHLAGVPIIEYCEAGQDAAACAAKRAEIEEEVRQSAYHIIDYKGATCFAVGQALVRIVGAILRNQHSVLTVSTLLQGEFGLEGLCLSVPCVVARDGVVRIVEKKLTPEEQRKLEACAGVLRTSLAELTR